jgi:ABC-2 type transport system permease protein
MTFSVFAGLAPSFGIIVLMQGSIVGEIKTGTASWILSKPITRESYILAKWFANSIGGIITMILVPTFLFYIQLALFTDVILNLTMFILVIVVLTLNMLFYLSLTLLMGSFQRNSAFVIAVPIAFYLSQQFLLEIFTFLVDVTPWILTAPLGDNSPSVVFSLITSIQSFSILPILAISLYVVVFLILTLKFMQTQEI